MNGKLQNTIRRNGPAILLAAGLVLVWELVSLRRQTWRVSGRWELYTLRP